MCDKNEFVISYTVEFDPAVYIFLEKLVSERNSTISKVINNIFREKALEELKPAINLSEQKPPHISWNYTDRSDLLFNFKKVGRKEDITIESSDSGTIFCGNKD